MVNQYISKKIISVMLIAMTIFTFLIPLPGITRAESSLPIDLNSINGTNWMSKISDKRLISEINIPGSHDAAMWEPTASGFVGLFSRKYAKTQTNTIKQQLDGGVRLLDIRMASEIDIDEEMDDVYCVHGKLQNFAVDCRFYATKARHGMAGDEYYMGSDVLSDVTEFLKNHPTETILLEMGYESDSSDEDLTYYRAQRLLDKYVSMINPSTGKPYIYRDIKTGGKIITHMPALGDTRGQIVILSKKTQALGYGIQYSAGNGWDDDTVAGINFIFENHYEANATKKKEYVEGFYCVTAPFQVDMWPVDSNPKAYDTEIMQPHYHSIPTSVDEHLNTGYVVCTSSNVAWADWKKLGDSPKDVADVVNPYLYEGTAGHPKRFSGDGEFYGWVYSDFVTADMAKTLYMTNYPNSLQYQKITYKTNPTYDSGDKVSYIQKGDTLKIDSSIIPQNEDDKAFIGWQIQGDTSRTYKSGEVVTDAVTSDIVLVPVYETTWEYIRKGFENTTSDITLQNDITATVSDKTIVIPKGKNCTLNLNGHSITGNSVATMFDVRGTLTIENSPVNLATISKGGKEGVNGGAFAVASEGKLEITGKVNVTDNRATKGGAIYAYPNSEITLNEEVTLQNNVGNFGGGIYLCGKDNNTQGASANIKGSKITGNTAGSIFGYGGGIYVGSDATISLSGEPQINNNNRSKWIDSGTTDVPNNIHLERANEPPVTINNAMNNSDIGISVYDSDMTDASYTIVKESGSGFIAGSAICIKSDDSNYSVAVADNTLVIGGKTLTVIFDTGGNATVANQEVKFGENATAPTLSNITQGKLFAGWYEDEECNKSFDFDKVITKDTTVYSKWLDGSGQSTYYNVYFDSNGGSSVEPKSVSAGDKVGVVSTPERVGYIFKGWYSDIKLTQSYNFESEVTGHMVLYAKWEEDKYTVTFNSNGGSAVESQEVRVGGTVTPPQANPTKEGFLFAGWYKNEGCEDSSKYNFNEPVRNALTLYAKWTPLYTITLDANGGSTIPTLVNQPYGTIINLSEHVPTRDNYVFQGWYQYQDITVDEAKEIIATYPELAADVWFDGDKVYFKFGSNLYVDNNYELTAIWKGKDCTVRFYNYTDGSDEMQVVSSQTVPYFDKVQKPMAPHIEGAEFDSWHVGQGSSTEYNFDNPVTGDVDLYATYRIATYTVSFDAKGGSPVDTAEVQYGVSVKEQYPESSFEPTRAGYDFLGWGELIGKGNKDDYDNLVSYISSSEEEEDKQYADKIVYNNGSIYYKYDLESEKIYDNTRLTAMWKRNGDPIPTPTPTPTPTPEPPDDESDNVIAVDEEQGMALVIDDVAKGAVTVPLEIIQSGRVHRMYNPNNGEHFYTKLSAEALVLEGMGWIHEKDADFAVVDATDKNAIAVYRLYNPNHGGTHFYTADANEAIYLEALGWRYEGISHYVYNKNTDEGTSQHRLYNPFSLVAEHIWTTDTGEVYYLQSIGWIDEGICWKVVY